MELPASQGTVQDQINEVKHEIKELRKDIHTLTQEIRALTKTCSRMDNHIDFVDGVYDTVRAPANYILSKIGYGTKPLENKKLDGAVLFEKCHISAPCSSRREIADREQ